MKALFLSLICLMAIGCKGVNKLIGQDFHSEMPYQSNVNPNDYYLQGMTTLDNDVVYMTTKERIITVEVKRPSDADFVILVPGIMKDYVVFTIPSDGIRFWNHSTPAHSLYRIHSVAN